MILVALCLTPLLLLKVLLRVYQQMKTEIFNYLLQVSNTCCFIGASLTYGGGGAPDNFAVWMLTWNYTFTRSGAIRDINKKRPSPTFETASSSHRAIYLNIPVNNIFQVFLFAAFCFGLARFNSISMKVFQR